MERSPYPALTNYAICIKRQGNAIGSFCGITFAVATQGDGRHFIIFVKNISLKALFHTLKDLSKLFDGKTISP